MFVPEVAQLAKRFWLSLAFVCLPSVSVYKKIGPADFSEPSASLMYDCTAPALTCRVASAETSFRLFRFALSKVYNSLPATLPVFATRLPSASKPYV